MGDLIDLATREHEQDPVGHLAGLLATLDLEHGGLHVLQAVADAIQTGRSVAVRVYEPGEEEHPALRAARAVRRDSNGWVSVPGGAGGRYWLQPGNR